MYIRSDHFLNLGGLYFSFQLLPILSWESLSSAWVYLKLPLESNMGVVGREEDDDGGYVNSWDS